MMPGIVFLRTAYPGVKRLLKESHFPHILISFNSLILLIETCNFPY